MGRSSQRHNREVHFKDSADQISVDGTGGGYGGGALLPIGQLTGIFGPWPAPGSFTVVSSGATTSSMSWTIPTDPADGTTLFGYVCARDGNVLFQANLSSPQTDNGPLEVGQVYNYTIRPFDSEGRLGAAATFEYTHS